MEVSHNYLSSADTLTRDRPGSMENRIIFLVWDQQMLCYCFNFAGIAWNKVPCYSSYVIRTLLTEFEVLILESRILVAGGILRKEGGLILFLVLGGTFYYRSHVLTCKPSKSERWIINGSIIVSFEAVSFFKSLLWKKLW